MPTTDEMIDGLEFYVLKRQIGIAEILAAEFANPQSPSPFQESGYAILSIVLPYFEMIEQLSTTQKSGAGASFANGFWRVYGNGLTGPQVKGIYERVRCGLFHAGMTRKMVIISREYDFAFQVCEAEIRINPARVVETVKQHFCCYLQRVRHPSCPERQAFEKFAENLDLEMNATAPWDATSGTRNPADNSSYL